MKIRRSRSAVEILLTALVAGSCGGSETAGDADTDTDEAPPEAVETVPGFRLVIEAELSTANPIADDRLPRMIELVDVTDTTTTSMRLPPPEAWEEDEVWAITMSTSSSGRWAVVHYQGAEPGVVVTLLHDLSIVRNGDPAGERLVAELDRTAKAEFSADEAVLVLRTPGEDIVLVDLDDPEHAVTAPLDLGGAKASRIIPRSGTSELVLVTSDQLWWHPGLPTDAAPVLLYDGIGEEPERRIFLHVELSSSNMLMFRIDGTVMLAELGEGELIDPRPIESPLGGDRSLPCDDALVVGPADAPALVCKDVTEETWFDPFWVPLDGAEPWAFHEIGPLRRNPMAIAASADGRYLVYQADHTSLTDREHDGWFVADTVTRSQPVRMDVEASGGSFWTCAGEVYLEFEYRMSRVVGIDGPTLSLEATEVEFSGPARFQSCHESDRWGQMGETGRRWIVLADHPGQLWTFTIDPPGSLHVGGWHEETGELIMAELEDCIIGGCNTRVVAHTLSDRQTRELWSGVYRSMDVVPIVARASP